MIHLRIAENLLSLIPGQDPARFALGNVAPDSGIPDEKWVTFTPPARVTHFSDHSGTDRKLADLEFYRRYLLPLQGHMDAGGLSFRMGYFFHLITDNLWSIKIGIPTRERFSADYAADKDFIWEAKKDWYGLDFIYIRDHPGCLFWRVFLTVQAETAGLDFLPLEGVRRNVAHIQQYYQRTDTEIQAFYNRPYTYLSPAQADDFVVESTNRILRIYNQLWINGMSAEGFGSVLDLGF
jgi:hypothetical protein